MAALHPAVGEAVCINLIGNVLLTLILSKHAVGKCCFITIGKLFAYPQERTQNISVLYAELKSRQTGMLQVMPRFSTSVLVLHGRLKCVMSTWQKKNTCQYLEHFSSVLV